MQLSTYNSIRSFLRITLPEPVISLLRSIRGKLKLSPMHRVLRGLKKRGVRLEELHAIEVFGYTGKLHTVDYASYVSTLEVWEIDPQYEVALNQNLPLAKIKITDSYKEIKNTQERYNFIVIDNPISIHGEHCEHFSFFPAIFDIAMDSTILILNTIPYINDSALKRYPYLFNEKQLMCRRSFYRTDHPESIEFDKMVEVYKDLITISGFNLEWYFFQKRNLFYYTVFKIIKSKL